MAKYFSIPLDKGYAQGVKAPEIPLGYWTGKNMIYGEDGVLRGRYTYGKVSNTVTGSSPSNHIIDVFATNTYIIAVSSDGKVYYKPHGDLDFIQCAWEGGGSPPYLDNSFRGEWGWLNGIPVYTNRMNYPIKITGSSYNYITGGTSGSFKCRHIIEHQNRLLLAGITSTRSMIRYSHIDNLDDGYFDNYVNVGDEMDDIVAAHSLGGNLIILKRNSIWAKLGTYSRLTSGQFQPIVEGIHFNNNGSVVGRNILFFADEGGLFAFSGGNMKNLTEPITYQWRHRDSHSMNIPAPRLGYWLSMDWLWATDGSAFDKPLVYDVKRGVWYRFDSFTPQCFANHNTTLIFGQFGFSNKAYVFRYGLDIGQDGAVETSFPQILQTPFLDLGNPHTVKYLRKIHLYAGIVDKVEVFFRNSPADPWGYNPIPQYVIDSPDDGETIHIDSSENFKEVSIKLTGSGKMIVKSLGVQFDERR